MSSRSKGSNNLFSQKDRGTSDDLEVLLLILKENPGIRFKVMERVKQAKTRIEIERKKSSKQEQAM